jgi:hypothetical protein
MAYSNTTGYPSVTTILRPWMDTTFFTEEARDRGTAVHNAAAAYLKGLYVRPLKPEWQGYFDSIRKWIDDYVVDTIVVEERLVDRALGFCGQLDLAARLHGENLPVQIDWKTGAPAPWHALQSAAYRHLLIEDRQIQTHRGLTVIPKPDGSGCRVVEHNNYRDIATFTACLSAWRFFNSK